MWNAQLSQMYVCGLSERSRGANDFPSFPRSSSPPSVRPKKKFAACLLALKLLVAAAVARPPAPAVIPGYPGIRVDVLIEGANHARHGGAQLSCSCIQDLDMMTL